MTAQYVSDSRSRRWHRITGVSESLMLILTKCGQAFWRKADDTYYGYDEKELSGLVCKACGPAELSGVALAEHLSNDHGIEPDPASDWDALHIARHGVRPGHEEV